MAKKIGILFVLFIACYMGAHYYIRWKNTKTDDVTKIGRLVECEPNEFRKMEIRQSGEGGATLKFERTDKPEAGVPSTTAVERWSWQAEAPIAGEADAAKIRRIAFAVCELYDPVRMRPGEFKASESKKRRGELLSAELEQGGKHIHLNFHFGEDTPEHLTLLEFTNGSSPSVVKVPNQFLQSVSLEAASYQNLRVMRTETDNIQQATLTVDGKERFTLQRSGSDWTVILAGKEKGSANEEAQKFINRAATLQGLSVENPSYSSADCLASKSKAVLSLKAVGGQEETLHFDFPGSGDVSACSSARTAKYQVHKDYRKYIDVPIGAVLAKKN